MVDILAKGKRYVWLNLNLHLISMSLNISPLLPKTISSFEERTATPQRMLENGTSPTWTQDLVDGEQT